MHSDDLKPSGILNSKDPSEASAILAVKGPSGSGPHHDAQPR